MMNVVSRARLAGRISLSSLYSTSSLQQWNSFTASRTTNPRSPNSPTGKAVVWPKPSEIPYEAIVPNFVTLFGYVKAPVQFHSAPEGFSAATAIAQEFTGGKDSVLIPLVFEGDLAHVVATHLNENDCVVVSGQLSSEPSSRFQLKEGLGKFHLVCQNLNFVHMFQSGMKSVGVNKAEDGGIRNVVSDDEKREKALEEAKVKNFLGKENWGTREPTIERVEGAETGDSGDKMKDGAEKKKDRDQWRDLVRNSTDWWDFRDQKAKGLKGEKFPDFTHKQTDYALWLESAPTWVLRGIDKLVFDAPFAWVKPVQRSQGFGEKKKSNVKDEESWKDLVENPSKWWDMRILANVVSGDHKREMALEEAKVKNFLGKENWGTRELSIERVEGAETGDSGDKMKDGVESGDKKKEWDQWRDLVRNSTDWWDFRDQKAKGLKGEKFPDFKHKQTDYALWLESAPTWVLRGIEKLVFDAPVAWVKPVQRSQGFGEKKKKKKKSNVKDEESWKDLVENPSKWWDNRTNKLNPKAPDFKHKETGQALWLNNTSPDWALSKLPPLS